MSYVRALTQECKPGTVEMLCREAEKTLVPHVRQIPGFLSYHIGKDAIVSFQSHIGEVILEAGGLPSEAHPSL